MQAFFSVLFAVVVAQDYDDFSNIHPDTYSSKYDDEEESGKVPFLRKAKLELIERLTPEFMKTIAHLPPYVLTWMHDMFMPGSRKVYVGSKVGSFDYESAEEPPEQPQEESPDQPPEKPLDEKPPDAPPEQPPDEPPEELTYEEMKPEREIEIIELPSAY